MSFFQAIGLGMKLIGGIQAAKAQEQASRDNAEAMVTDRIRGEAQAAQQQVASTPEIVLAPAPAPV